MAVLLEIAGFLSSLWMLGALGFRWGIVRGSIADASLQSGAARAGGIGALGAVLGCASALGGVERKAEAKHVAFADGFAAAGGTLIVQLALLGVLLAAFAAAWRGAKRGWVAAAVVATIYSLRALAAGRLGGLVNPLHTVGASLWIGTLFVLVTCGLAPLMLPGVTTEEREATVATLVRRFSPLALAAAGLLGCTGLITAWTHLHQLDALWTTPYGAVLFKKLFVVALVVMLGAWNWRRVAPALGKDGGARKIRASATIELVLAAVVLVLTGILLTTPSPRRAPTHEGQGGASPRARRVGVAAPYGVPAAQKPSRPGADFESEDGGELQGSSLRGEAFCTGYSEASQGSVLTILGLRIRATGPLPQGSSYESGDCRAAMTGALVTVVVPTTGSASCIGPAHPIAMIPPKTTPTPM
jgi:copper transport protein